MNLKEEYERCLSQILTVNFEKGNMYWETILNSDHDASLFEFTIRYVGGLLGAYEMTERTDSRLILKAKEMADRLIHAFESETGLPYGIINLKTYVVFLYPMIDIFVKWKEAKFKLDCWIFYSRRNWERAIGVLSSLIFNWRPNLWEEGIYVFGEFWFLGQSSDGNTEWYGDQRRSISRIYKPN